jgi:hypothetical protein
MNPSPITVSSSLDRLRWVEDFVHRDRCNTFPVVSDGRLEGVVSAQAMAQVLRT